MKFLFLITAAALGFISAARDKHDARTESYRVSPAADSSEANLPELTGTDIADCIITRNEVISGTSLWGHINGGADLYLEYGFKTLRVQELTRGKNHFKVSIYRMETGESSFGIFSVSKNRCSGTDSVAAFQCITPYHIQAAYGPLYISVANENGSAREQAFCIKLASLIVSKSGNSVFDIPPLFRDKNLISHSGKLKFIKGELGLSNGFPEWGKLFDSVRNFSFYVLPLELEDGYINIALIKFSGDGDVEKFINSADLRRTEAGSLRGKTSGKVRAAVRLISSTRLIYLESDLRPELYGEYLKVAESWM